MQSLNQIDLSIQFQSFFFCLCKVVQIPAFLSWKLQIPTLFFKLWKQYKGRTVALCGIIKALFFVHRIVCSLIVFVWEVCLYVGGDGLETVFQENVIADRSGFALSVKFLWFLFPWIYILLAVLLEYLLQINVIVFRIFAVVDTALIGSKVSVHIKTISHEWF